MKNKKTNKFQWIRSLVIIPIFTIQTVTLSGKEIQFISPVSVIAEKSQVTNGNNIGGKITDVSSQPVSKVTVTVKGTTKKTSTDKNGNFKLSDIADGSILSFSKSGYNQIELHLNEAETLKGKNNDILVVINKSADGKKMEEVTITQVLAHINLSEKEKAAVLVDDIQVHPDKFDTYIIKQVKSIAVMEGTTAKIVYGEGAKNGIIIIKTTDYENKR
jgi:hypothetical protein